jgi:hypothetical protein
LKTDLEIINSVIGDKFPRRLYKGYRRVDAAVSDFTFTKIKTSKISEILDSIEQCVKKSIVRIYNIPNSLDSSSRVNAKP